MIKDERIDLTQGFKFGQPERRFATTAVGEMARIIELDRRLPWKHRPIEPGDWGKRYKRKYGDRLSDDMGFTVRQKTDGKWFSTQPLRYTGAVLDLLFEYGIESGELVSSCCRCGRIRLSKAIYIPCEKCTFDYKEQETIEKLFPEKKKVVRYIPWKDFSLDFHGKIIHNDGYHF